MGSFRNESPPRDPKIAYKGSKNAAKAVKGQCHEIFYFWFFSWISFPQTAEYTIRAVSNFLENSREIFAAQGAPPVSLTPVVNGKNFQSEKF